MELYCDQRTMKKIRTVLTRTVITDYMFIVGVLEMEKHRMLETPSLKTAIKGIITY